MIIISEKPRHTSYVDSPGQGYISFPNSTEKSTVMHQPGDPVVDNNLSQVFIVQNVRVDKGACKEVKKYATSIIRTHVFLFYAEQSDDLYNTDASVANYPNCLSGKTHNS